MGESAKVIISQALELKAAERAAVVEQLLASLDSPDTAIDAIWAKEVDARLEAYDRGEIDAIPAEEVFAKYRRS